MSDKYHPLWGIFRMALGGAILIAGLHFHYSGGLDLRDIFPVMEIVLLLGGYELNRRRAEK